MAETRPPSPSYCFCFIPQSLVLTCTKHHHSGPFFLQVKAAHPPESPSHVVPRPTVPTSEPVSTQLLSESGQEEVIVVEVQGC